MDMLSRRSIRHYSDRPVSDELLRELLTKAYRASNTGNMQVYSVVVSRSQEIKDKLAPLHFNQPAVRGAAAVLTFCADFKRFSDWCRLSGAEPCYDNFLSFYTASVDAVIVAQTFAVAAEEAGLGLCYLGTTNYNPVEIAEVLHLPELVFPVTTLTVGYPAENPHQTERLPYEAVTHFEVYDDKQDIKSLYAEKESLPENQSFVAENGKQTLAHVFTDIRYPRQSNEAASENLFRMLKKAGFIV